MFHFMSFKQHVNHREFTHTYASGCIPISWFEYDIKMVRFQLRISLYLEQEVSRVLGDEEIEQGLEEVTVDIVIGIDVEPDAKFFMEVIVGNLKRILTQLIPFRLI